MILRELITNLTFVRNLSLTMMIAIASLYGLAELQSQRLLRQKTTEPTLTVGQNAQLKLANFATAKVIINRQ